MKRSDPGAPVPLGDHPQIQGGRVVSRSTELSIRGIVESGELLLAKCVGTGKSRNTDRSACCRDTSASWSVMLSASRSAIKTALSQGSHDLDELSIPVGMPRASR